MPDFYADVRNKTTSQGRLSHAELTPNPSTFTGVISTHHAELNLVEQNWLRSHVEFTSEDRVRPCPGRKFPELIFGGGQIFKHSPC